MTRTLRCILVLLGALLALVRPSPAVAAGSIQVNVSPNVLLADGISTAIVTAYVRSSNGRPARDGTEVRFYTTGGNITQFAFTSAGLARATLTSSAVPQAANITIAAGIDQTVMTVPMVSKLIETSVGGRVVKVEGKYVAFSEDRRIIQADEQVRLHFRGLTLDSTSAQMDLNRETIKAIGKVVIAGDGQTLTGQRLWINLKTMEGYIVEVGTRRWFSGYGLTELPERPKNLNPDFDLQDLSDSKMLWVAKSANYVVGERVQMQSARAFVGGVKSLKMPFHQVNLRDGIGSSTQYVGVGSEGITLDLPLYLAMSPNSSTALRMGYGSKTGGIGNFTRQRGLSVDLVQKYGFSGASEGQAMLTNLSSIDRWGFQWNHIQQVNKTTRLVTDLQFPEHRDLYGRLNLTTGLPIGNLQIATTASRLEGTQLAKTLNFAFESKPRQLLDGKLAVSAETSFFYRDRQPFRAPTALGGIGSNRLKTFNLGQTDYQTFGLKLRPVPATLAKGLQLDTSLSLRSVTGSTAQAGFGPALETNLRKQLPRNGMLSLGLSYNHLQGINDFLPTSGRTNANLNLSYPVTNKLRITALGTLALDADNQNSILQMSYQLNPQWRFDLLQSMYRFGGFGQRDHQFGISRSFGDRELGLYWSRLEHRFIIEFGAARF